METRTGDYYLIARDLNTDEVFRIPIDRNWYIPQATSERIYGNDIAVIDYVTLKFKSRRELIHRLYTNHYIDTENVDLYITHLHKFNENKYLKEYDVLVNNSDRVKPLVDLAKSRIKNEPIKDDNPTVDSIMNKFISKSFSNKPFYELITCVWSRVDKYVIQKLNEYHKKEKIDWSIKYVLKDKKTSYLVLRNIISMWNTYDELMVGIKDLPVEEQAKQIIKDYATKLNNGNIPKEEKTKLKVKLDKDYIEGQINMEDYLKEKIEEIDPMEQMLIDADNLKQEPFDSFELQELEKMYGRLNVMNHLNVDLIISLSPKDRYILGFIDYVEYKNQMHDSDIKNK